MLLPYNLGEVKKNLSPSLFHKKNLSFFSLPFSVFEDVRMHLSGKNRSEALDTIHDAIKGYTKSALSYVFFRIDHRHCL
jgi:hypothetical protein